jgi:hypothetical protein
MKKIQILIITLGLGVITCCSCRHLGKHVTVVSTTNNHVNVKIEYAGRVIFNDNKNGIISISRGGYFKYQNHNDKISAECNDKGTIVYELNGETQTPVLNDEARQLMTEAIKEVEKNKMNTNG